MKKIAYLSMLFVALTLMSFSCEKNDDDVIPQTLEEKYPDWSNLTWVSTDGSVDTYPRMNITITGNTCVFSQPYNGTGGIYTESFSNMLVTSSSVTFSGNAGNDATITGTYTKSGSQITLITKGFIANSRTYVLQIN